ncbi:hypothetical protein D3C87_1183550 [compost metagenome]
MDSKPVGGLVCENCEKRFERSDVFAAEFFKEQKFLKKTTEPDYYETFFGFENHHKSARVALLYFLVGTAIKQHLYGLKQGDDLLGSTYERLAQDYSGRFIEENDYQFLVVKQTESLTVVTPPIRSRIEEYNAIEMMILGYRFYLITDQRPLPVNSPIRKLAQQQELVIMIEETSTDSLYKNFLAFMEERFA